ncbi:hypothetical protein [Planctellipticum variicoloris]|uniref:hypothetical protein n=1 Tax=Planctellipticum variicoloris TaxID=3064265 RepID=UPI0030141497|nr:MICOS complex subunit MIC60 [Planctomycetaceae bacterium SH412]
MRTDRVCRSLILAALTLGANSGCASMAARWNAYLECKAEKHVARNEFRQSELEALKQELELERAAIRAQREAELAALKAEREHELACLQADAEKQNCQLRSQYEESVRTQLGLDLDQRITIGQLQVNPEELQQLLEERERDHADRMRVYKQLKEQQARSQFEQWKQAQLAGPCCTCSRPSCDAPEPGCDTPHVAGCCQRCGLPQQPLYSNDCAGTRPFREAPTRPVQEPLTAAQIPLMLPVTIEVGMTNSRIAQSNVRRLPQRGMSALNAPCQQCEGCRRGNGCARQAPLAPSCEVPGSPSKNIGQPTQIPVPPVPAPIHSGDLVPQPAPPSEVTNAGADDEVRSSKFKLSGWLEEDSDDPAPQ